MSSSFLTHGWNPALTGGFFTTGATWEAPTCPEVKSCIHSFLQQLFTCCLVLLGIA